MELLTAQEVSYQYKTKYQTVFAVNSVSCKFEQGNLYAIVGKSGSGKTTFLSLLAGLVLPTGGKILFQNTPTTEMNLDLYRRDHASVIYQNFNLFPLLTAEENVMYPLLLKKIEKAQAREKAKEKLIAVGLGEDYCRRFPAQMSGGEQQRVAIARALAAESEVILADEPTGNLDTENSKKIIKILKDLAHNQNCCVIIVTHDTSIAAEAEQVLNMKDGTLE